METAEHGTHRLRNTRQRLKRVEMEAAYLGDKENKENCLKWRLPDMAQPGGKNGSGEEERESCTLLLLRQRIQEVPEKKEKKSA